MKIEEKAGLPVASESENYNVSRFNATRHAILSKYNVLPLEDERGIQAAAGGNGRRLSS
jgi:hypothetical protein